MLGTLVLASLFSFGLCAGGWSEVTVQTQIDGYEQLLAGLGSNAMGADCPTTMIETQVVSGLNIRYTKTCANGAVCTFKVWQQVWTNTLQITEHKCQTKKRQLGLPGGYSEVDPTDSQYSTYMSLLTPLKTNGQLTLHNYQVEKIESQVVAGMNIRFTLSYGKETCMIVVYDVPWESKTTVTSNTCPMHKRQLMGGYNKVDVNDDRVQKCLAMSLDKVNAMSNSMFRLVEGQVMDAQMQVVAGLNIKLRFTTAPSTCMNSGDQLGKTAMDCPVDSNAIMTANTFDAHCFINLQQDIKVSVSMFEEPEISNEPGNGKEKPAVIKANPGLVQSKPTTRDKVGLEIPAGRQLLGYKHPLLTVVRRKRDLNFLIEKLNRVADDKRLGDLVDEGKKLLGGGDDHDLVNHVKDLLGKDGHDLVDHYQKVLGGDDHDLVDHVSNLLGKDGHDLIKHGQNLLGGDGHDLENHGKILLGGDDHDYKNHGQQNLGGDDHDYKNHGQKILGGDGHDYKNHGQKILGGDGHDYKNHGQNILGGDDHDYKNHGQNILGGDDHDYKNHGQNILGGDDHDYKNHGQKILGGDDHDYKNHGQKILGGDDHDYKNHGQNLLGGDDHDYCHIGMFKDFKAKFNKLYDNAKEEKKRFMTFCDNMRMVRKLQQTEKGSAVYGATKFADLTKEEFKKYVGKPWDLTANDGMKKATIPRVKAPESFDWRDHGAVTPVKNQGSCGSCWAFSTTGNIEGQWFIKKKKLVSLSEQELVDCDKIDEGCNGGLPSNAYKEIERLGGLETETDYSYKGDDEKCIFNETDVKVFINDSVSVSSDEDEMASWLSVNGPISIGINAFAMQFYMGGISHPWSIFCNPKDLDHGVLIVGYGVQDSKPYWIVKNSWGPDWGEKGYYLVYRGAGVCGLNTMCTSAVVD